MLRTHLERLRSIMLEMNILENELIDIINNVEGMGTVSEESAPLSPPPFVRQHGGDFSTPPPAE